MILNQKGMPLYRRMGFITEFNIEKSGPREPLVSACGLPLPAQPDTCRDEETGRDKE
jgi:hypothetical protein